MREYLDSWQKSSHKQAATCNDCHTPHALIPKLYAKGENGIRHSWKFTFQTYPERLQITSMNLSALEENCIGCHGEFVAEIRAGNRHESLQERNCVHCHDGVGQGAGF
jgi:cytochrome c nitrite reductase small subunit